ncbi:DNA excision repair protein ERCC-5 [Spea bombifrons]|uniref:DNA excision repair protein ERCC-5 n=1 Tax=Spea bombifrons TaxID=233779 RepID=UPI00234B0F81|nr:DNA excision repair protein ERCC-5 [Spea bombifrons]
MGVQGLWKLLECSGRPINPETLEGKILAVDISIWLNQAVKGARDRHGNAIQNAHLLTLFHRLCKLLFFRIRPIFVFDGEAPLLKRQTLAKRRQKKETAADEAKKTSDKLLRTFLKRQAIKAALTEGSSKEEEYPSLSHVRRKEEDDIYALPPLEVKDNNSSEEEEEREWEERMTQKQILQEEYFANPHSVDIESEDFKSLPPEVKHEILNDMKEFTKRRRTLLEAMPEDSNDFSRYQLRGLLKKNDLNRCIRNVREEMSQQYSGEVRAQIETEGGFMREVETRRLVSEDTSHYILIKGIQAKEEKKEDSTVKAVSSAHLDTAPKTYLDLKLASARKPKNNKDIQAEAAPPSPRTLFAIQEAMMENSSEEEFGKGEVDGYNMPSRSVGEIEGNVSPRTMRAIQQALAEDEPNTSSKNQAVEIRDESETEVRSKAKTLIISSSEEENDDLAITAPLQNTEFSPSPTQCLKSTEHNLKLVPASKKEELLLDQNKLQVVDIDLNQQRIKRNLFSDQDKSVSSSSMSHLVDAKPETTLTPLVLETNKPEIIVTNVDPSTGIPAKIEISTQNSSDNPPVTVKHSKPERTVESSAPLSNTRPSVSNALVVDNTTYLEPEIIKGGMHPKSTTESLKPSAASTEPNEDNAQRMEPVSSNNPDAMYFPMTPESIEVGEEESARNKEAESDSDGSFIDVNSDAGDSDSQLAEIKILSDEKEASTKPSIPEPSSTGNTRGSDGSLGNSFMADNTEEPQEKVSDDDEEVAVNEWQDLSMEELESLENNLFVEQTSLQAQRQQQERVAATVTGQMCLESQELLRLFGIPFIVAPMEAEAQCAILDLTDQTSGTITDDSDIWLFGARHVYKNFFTQNKYVMHYQFSDIQNQLGLDRSRLINLAYLMGSDYTEGIPSVGYVSAMEILNEFPGQGLESLVKFKDWWTEAQKHKKIRPNPHDTKVKKKLRDLVLHPCFPDKAVAEAYLRPTVDDSQGAFSWGRPDLEQIREFCESRFGWYRSKTDEVLLPVLKQLNSQKTQLRIDTFFRVEQHEVQALKSQRLRRAVTCLKRKEKEGDALEVEDATQLMEKEFAIEKATESQKSHTDNAKAQSAKRKRSTKQLQEKSDPISSQGGFIGGGISAFHSAEESDSDSQHSSPKIGGDQKVLNQKVAKKSRSSSSSDEEENTVLVTARPVFQGKRKSKALKGRKK